MVDVLLLKSRNLSFSAKHILNANNFKPTSLPQMKFKTGQTKQISIPLAMFPQ